MKMCDENETAERSASTIPMTLALPLTSDVTRKTPVKERTMQMTRLRDSFILLVNA